jgi:hypothetical protein
MSAITILDFGTVQSEYSQGSTLPADLTPGSNKAEKLRSAPAMDAALRQLHALVSRREPLSSFDSQRVIRLDSHATLVLLDSGQT